VETNTRRTVDLLAARLECLAVPVGQPSVTALAIVLGKLCRRFGVDPGEAFAVARLAHCAFGAERRMN
jgi:hypothetical protein